MIDSLLRPHLGWGEGAVAWGPIPEGRYLQLCWDGREASGSQVARRGAELAQPGPGWMLIAGLATYSSLTLEICPPQRGPARISPSPDSEHTLVQIQVTHGSVSTPVEPGARGHHQLLPSVSLIFPPTGQVPESGG